MLVSSEENSDSDEDLHSANDSNADEEQFSDHDEATQTDSNDSSNIFRFNCDSMNEIIFRNLMLRFPTYY